MPTWTDCLREVIHVAIAFGFSTLILVPLWRWVKKIADSLDPEKPGGVTEQLDRLALSQKNRDALQRTRKIGG